MGGKLAVADDDEADLVLSEWGQHRLAAFREFARSELPSVGMEHVVHTCEEFYQQAGSQPGLFEQAAHPFFRHQALQDCARLLASLSSLNTAAVREKIYELFRSLRRHFELNVMPAVSFGRVMQVVPIPELAAIVRDYVSSGPLDEARRLIADRILHSDGLIELHSAQADCRLAVIERVLCELAINRCIDIPRILSELCLIRCANRPPADESVRAVRRATPTCAPLGVLGAADALLDRLIHIETDMAELLRSWNKPWTASAHYVEFCQLRELASTELADLAAAVQVQQFRLLSVILPDQIMRKTIVRAIHLNMLVRKLMAINSAQPVPKLPKSSSAYVEASVSDQTLKIVRVGEWDNSLELDLELDPIGMACEQLLLTRYGTRHPFIHEDRFRSLLHSWLLAKHVRNTALKQLCDKISDITHLSHLQRHN